MLLSSLVENSFTGCITGLTAYASFALGKYTSSLLAKSCISVFLSGLGVVFSDSMCQFARIKLKQQARIDKKKLIVLVASNILNRSIKEALKLTTFLIMITNESKKTSRLVRFEECKQGKDEEECGFMIERSLTQMEEEVEDNENIVNSLMLSFV